MIETAGPYFETRKERDRKKIAFFKRQKTCISVLYIEVLKNSDVKVFSSK